MNIVKSNLKIKSFSFDAGAIDPGVIESHGAHVSDSSEDMSHEHKRNKTRKDRKEKRGKSHKRDKRHKREEHQREEHKREDYFIDKAGDELNLKYGTVHGIAIPEYSRWGDSIIGSCFSDWKIEKLKHRFLVLRSTREKGKRLKYVDFRKSMNGPPQRVKRLEEEKDTDFISFKTLDLLDNYKTDKGNEENQVLLEDEEFREQSGILNGLVQKDPYDLQKWIDLIKFQDQFAKNEIPSSSIRRRIQEKKMYMFEKALEYLPRNDVLLSKYLATCMQVLEDSEMLSKWDDILNSNRDSFLLWDEYITYRISNFASFSVGSCLQVFEDCLVALSKDSNQASRENEEQLLWIFTRLCLFLSQAGYVERSIALFQGMIEFNYYCPEAYAGLSLEQRRDLFEFFWEKEFPRFGQEDAPGWLNTIFMGKHSVLILDPNDIDEQKEIMPEYESSGSDSNSLFLKIDHIVELIRRERFLEFYNWLPQNAEEDVEDPYRTVLFEDISPFLFELRDKESRFSLILHFIHFLGVPVTDNVIFTSPLFFTFWKRHEKASLFDFPVCHPNPGFGTFFVDSNWYRNVGEEQIQYIESSAANKKEFIRNILEQAKSIEQIGDRILPIYLMFESSLDYKSAHKCAKSLLKSDQSNVYLWNSFAHLEQSNSKTMEAKKVYLTALEAFKSSPDSRLGLESVYMSLAELEMLLGNRDGALSVIVSGAENVWEGYFTPTSLRLLRAKKEYSAQISHLLTTQFFKESMESRYFTLCKIYNGLLLEYLSSENISSVLTIIQTYSALIQDSKFLEGLYELECKFLHHYAVSSFGGYKPGLIRESLEDIIQKFPDNTLFLTMYGWNEQKSNFENRLRRTLDLNLSRSSSLISRLYFLWSEIHLKTDINVHYLTTLFDNCILESHDPVIWILYIQYEISRGNLSSAKSLYFQGIRSCPWSKEMYLLAFESLSSLLDESDFGQIVQVMQDKQVRTRSLA